MNRRGNFSVRGPARMTYGAIVMGMLGLTLAVHAVPVVAADGAKKAMDLEKIETIPLKVLLDPAPGGQAHATLAVIQKSFAEAQTAKRWDPSQGHPLAYLPANTVLLQALHHNLSIQTGQLDAAIARQAIEEADAVFSPVFTLDLGHSSSMVYERRNSGPVFLKRSQPTPTDGGKSYLVITPPPPDPYQVDRIGFLKQEPSTVNKNYKVSLQQEPGWLDTKTGTLTIQQQLPWGPRLTLTKDTSYKETYYDPNRAKSWDAPWAITVKASLNAPLPFGKNFGRYSSAETAVEQAKIADRQADWNLKTVINNTLRKADLAYWDLVQAMENLLTSIENRQYLEARAAYAERMLIAGRVTQYGRDQMAMELARAKLHEASAQQALVTVSAALVVLIKEDRSSTGEALLLPVEYQNRLAEAIKPVDNQQAIATALARRPELQIKDLALQSSLLAHRFMENQARPNLLFSGGGNMKQSNATYGYDAYPEAVSNVLSPDSQAVNGSLSYTYPWRNRVAKAALTQAGYALEGAQLSQQSSEQMIHKEVDDALVSMASARARLGSARNHEKLAALALEKAKSRWELTGDIGEMELLSQSRALLDARLARIAAMVDCKKAETQLAAAQGTLSEGLADQVAVNPFDRQRLALLAASGATPHFSAPEATFASVHKEP